nr:MAG TPA: hypothetical protein [Caudoviricetes sp.]
MTRIIEAEMETDCKKASTAINRFFKKFPALADEWRETIEWMAESGTQHYSDDTVGGRKNPDWCYALSVEIDETYAYICIIERA